MAGWQLGKILSDLEIAGRSIGEWVQTGYAHVDKFLAHMKYFFAFVAETSNLVWSGFGKAVTVVFYEVMSLLAKIPGVGALLGIFGDMEKKAADARSAYDGSLEASRRAYDANMAAARKSRDDQVAFADRVLGSFEEQTGAVKKAGDAHAQTRRKQGAAETEFVLKLADVNQSFERMSDILEKARYRYAELGLEIKKATASPQEAKFLDIEKDYQDALKKADGDRKEIEKALQEAQERVAKAEETAAKKNKNRQKTDPIQAVDPQIYRGLAEAKEKQAQVAQEISNIVEAETRRRNSRIGELNKEFDREIEERTQSDYALRIAAAQKWAAALIRVEKAPADAGIFTQEEYERRRQKILGASGEVIAKMTGERNSAIVEAQTRLQLSLLDMQEKEMAAPKADI
jgi:hypothetical protein